MLVILQLLSNFKIIRNLKHLLKILQLSLMKQMNLYLVRKPFLKN